MTEKKAGDGREEEDLVAVVEGEDDQEGADTERGSEGEDDEREGRDAAGEGDDDDPERRRSLNRERKRERKRRAHEFRERDARTIEAQARRIEELERRIGGVEDATDAGHKARVDDAIRQTDNTIKILRDKRKKAIADVDAEEVDRLDDELYKARRHREDLDAFKRQQSTERRDGGVDADVQHHARQFFADHTWFNPTGKSQDDFVARAVDKALLSEGRLNPSSEGYWTELRRRLKDALPHRFKGQRHASDADDGDDDEYEPEQTQDRNERRTQPAERKRPPTMGSGGNGAQRPKGVTITKEQKDAMIAAGKWEDPKERQRMLRYYQDYNRQQAAERAGR